MSVLVQSLGDFIKIVVQAFNLSSTFPALILALLVQLFVLPSVPTELLPPMYVTADAATQTGMALIGVALLAYLLDAANLPIIRLFEGYWFRNQIPLKWCEALNRRYVIRTRRRISGLEGIAADLIRRARKEKRPDLLVFASRIVTYKRALIERIADKYPDDPTSILSSPFGNVISAAECYPQKTFGMDAVTLWPFLVPILGERNYAQYLVRERGVMNFLVNTTIVLLFFGVLLWYSEVAFVGWNEMSAWKLALVVVACFICFVLSVQAAASWGVAVRTSFVLFRDDLRQALRLRSVQSYRAERDMWEKASNFLRGQDSDDHQMQLGRAIFNASSYKQPSARRQEK